jgi:hypothetical protein
MKLAKTIAIGAAAIGLSMGSALADEGQSGMNDNRSLMVPSTVQEETFILLEPVEVTHIYGIDENRDGVTDGYLFLEQSDTRG